MSRTISNPYLKALERYNQKTKYRSQKELSIQNVIEEKLGEFTYIKEQGEDYEGELNDIADNINSESMKLQGEETKRRMGAAKTLGGSILTQSKQKELSSRLGAYSRSSSVQLSAYADVSRSTTSLESGVQSRMTGIETLTEKMQGLIGPTGNITDEKLMRRYATGVGTLEKGVAQSQLSLKYQKEQGLDPIGIVSGAQTIAGRAQGILEKDDITRREAKGEFGNVAQESDNLAKKLNILTDAISSLSKATDAERDGKQKLVQQATKDVQQQEIIRNAVKQGGGGSSDLDSASAILNGLSKTLGNIGSTYGQVQIDNPLRIMQNQTRFMGMHNERYTAMQKMTQGDQMSMMKIMGMYGGNKDFSDEFLGKGSSFMATKLGSAGLGLAADAAKIAGVTTVTGGLGGAAFAATQLGDISGGIGNMVSLASDYRNNITAGGIAADAYDRRKDMFEALNAIPANQRQAHEDQYRRSYRAGIGMGAGNTIESGLINYGQNSTLRQLASLNVSPEKAAMLTELGGQTIGGRDLTMDTITSAAKAERAGMVSTEQYMQLAGSMTDVGGGSKDLYNALKMAVTTGMDDSKSISRMVSATVSLADKSSSTGMITSEGVSEAVLQASKFGDTMMTTSQRARVGAAGTSAIDNLLSRGGTDIYSLQELSSITSAVKGTDISQAGRISLEKAGLSDVSSIRDLLGDKDSSRYKKAVESVTRAGWGGLVGNQSAIKGVLAAKGRTVGQRVMGLGTEFTEEARSYIQDTFSGENKIDSYDKFTETLGGIDAKSLSEFRARAKQQGVTGESLFNVFQGRKIMGKSLAPTMSRAVKASKFATQGEREFWESEQGMDKVLEATGYGEWKKQRANEIEGILVPGSGAGTAAKDKANWFKESSEQEKKQGYHEVSQSLFTKYMKSAAGKEVFKEHEDRTEAAGRQEGPGALLDAGKTFDSAAKAFGASISGDFKAAIAQFQSAVDGMNKLSSRPNMTKYTDNMKENLKNEVINAKKHLGRNY